MSSSKKFCTNCGLDLIKESGWKKKVNGIEFTHKDEYKTFLKNRIEECENIIDDIFYIKQWASSYLFSPPVSSPDYIQTKYINLNRQITEFYKTINYNSERVWDDFIKKPNYFHSLQLYVDFEGLTIQNWRKALKKMLKKLKKMGSNKPKYT